MHVKRERWAKKRGKCKLWAEFAWKSPEGEDGATISNFATVLGSLGVLIRELFFINLYKYFASTYLHSIFDKSIECIDRGY